jgi:AraC-like DNA-binding protein
MNPANLCDRSSDPVDTLHPHPATWEAQRAELNRQELRVRIARAVPADGMREPLPGLFLHRISTRSEPVHGVSHPAMCVIAQGSKEVLLGAERYQYDPAHYLLTTVELPVVSQILAASPEQPYLSLRVQLDPNLVGAMLVEANIPSPRNQSAARAIDVSPLEAGLLDAVVRLVRLVESPVEARVLTPLVLREIVYRLLVGAQGARLRHIAVLGGYSHHIARAVERLWQEFNQPLRVEQIAQELGMSVSGFHHQFKAVTAMSPLQFQKRLRLQEARRLMLGEQLDAASAGARVGYADAAHFNREYRSFFGLPPMRDVERLRVAAGARTREAAKSR